MTGPRAKDVVLTVEAQADLRDLEHSPSKEATAMVRRIRALRSVLLADCLHGEVVKRPAIPKGLRERFQLENLYVKDLPGFWRLLYSVVREQGERYVVVVRIVDHATYSRWFPGRGR